MKYAEITTAGTMFSADIYEIECSIKTYVAGSLSDNIAEIHKFLYDHNIEKEQVIIK